MNTLSDANIRSMSFLSWFLNDQMSKMISCHVSVDTIVEAIRCIPQQVGIYDNMSGILGWWLRKTAISKALIVVLSMTLMSFILGALSGSNYNTIVNATEKLDTLESFHIKGVQHTQNGDIDFDVYIKNTDDMDEYYAVATTTIPEEVGYYYVFHYKDNQCQKYITTTPVDLNSIDGSQFGEYLTPSTNGNDLVDCYILSSKSLYKEILTMQPDSYDIALLKVYGRLFSGDENLRIRAVDKVRVLDEENIKKFDEIKLENQERVKNANTKKKMAKMINDNRKRVRNDKDKNIKENDQKKNESKEKVEAKGTSFKKSTVGKSPNESAEEKVVKKTSTKTKKTTMTTTKKRGRPRKNTKKDVKPLATAGRTKKKDGDSKND